MTGTDAMGGGAGGGVGAGEAAVAAAPAPVLAASSVKASAGFSAAYQARELRAGKPDSATKDVFDTESEFIGRFLKRAASDPLNSYQQH